jgi:ribosomal protein L19
MCALAEHAAPNQRADAAIRAELFGDDGATALGIKVQASAPVLALCRRLVEAGHDPAAALEAWRGVVLCLRVRSIGEAAQLRLAGHGVGFERIVAPPAAPPVANSDAAYVGAPPDAEAAP